MMLSKSQIKMMQEEMYAELVQILMDRCGYTFERLQGADTDLYYQGHGYVYSFLSNELNFGNYRK